jgi:hypothetical protein
MEAKAKAAMEAKAKAAMVEESAFFDNVNDIQKQKTEGYDVLR